MCSNAQVGHSPLARRGAAKFVDAGAVLATIHSTELQPQASVTVRGVLVRVPPHDRTVVLQVVPAPKLAMLHRVVLDGAMQPT